MSNEFVPRAGALRGKTTGEWMYANPGDLMFSSVTMIAEEYFNGKEWVSIFGIDPREDGAEAALRQGRYEGVTSTPECPYANGTKENEEWWDAFGNATEDLIRYNNGDY